MTSIVCFYLQIDDLQIGSSSRVLFVIDYVRLFDNAQSDVFSHHATDYTDGRLWQQRAGDVATDGLLFVMSFDGSESS